MKRIGFVDYYLSEWHANHYPAWIEEASRALGEPFAVTAAWAELDVSPVDGVDTDAWCAQFGVRRAPSVEALCREVDCIIVLAPSDPEKHLSYAEQVLPFGKPTYIDKTFAPDLATAERIFALADRYGTPLFSSSALRYGSELAGLSCQSVGTTGGGSNLSEYIVHQAEMVIKLLDAEPLSASVERTDSGCVCRAELAGGKRAVMTYSPELPFAFSADGEGMREVNSPIFPTLMRDMLRFFGDGKPSFPREQTLWVMKLRDLILQAY